MKPDKSKYNPDPEYFRELVESTGLSITATADELGVTRRALQYFMNGERKFSYQMQFALECLVFSD